MIVVVLVRRTVVLLPVAPSLLVLVNHDFSVDRADADACREGKQPVEREFSGGSGEPAGSSDDRVCFDDVGEAWGATSSRSDGSGKAVAIGRHELGASHSVEGREIYRELVVIGKSAQMRALPRSTSIHEHCRADELRGFKRTNLASEMFFLGVRPGERRCD